jgi:signal transduction histidine kinase
MSEQNMTSLGEANTTLHAQLREQAQLADVGELAGQVTHKFNNFLNSLLLKIALLETELPEPAAAKFADIKQQAKSMAEVIKQVHRCQRRQPFLARILDLNLLVRQVAESISREAAEASRTVSLQLVLSSRPALVSGSAVDFQRLCAFLLRNRLAGSASPNRTLILRTEVGTDKVLFTLEDRGLTLAASLLATLFEADAKSPDGGSNLELAACKALVRRHQGRIHARAGDAGGIIVEAEFPLAERQTPAAT